MAPCPQPTAPLTPAQKPSHGGLTGWLDGKVEAALKASGLMHYLEKVTGDLDALNAAAEEWQAQARAVRAVSEQLRAEGNSVAAQWEGDASDAFGRHMGEVVEALDSTAEGMDQTAQIINQAATMCALAEGMVVDIISEAIEALAASLAAEAVITVLTFGLGAIAGAMLDAVEISAFIARVAKVSEELATSLEKLVEALKELNTAVKAVRSLKDAKEALSAFKEVKTALNAVRDVEKGGEGLGKIAKDAKEAKSLEGVGGKLADLAARKAAGKLDGYLTDQLTSHVEDGVKHTLFGDADDDRVSAEGRLRRGPKPPEGEEDERPTGLAGAVKDSVLGVVQDTRRDPAVKQAVEGEIGYRLQGTVVGDALGDEDPQPYRVDRSRIETAFG
ncbi:WXG100 family type VII secretion target [Kitasatospora sp. NPDC002227]|uniref:WXG100 family type VII secretion target n=1 Tax=Kitasatospora sp. NPDC002227 TaxID=3154773 RepID=UPI0033245341